MENNLKRIMEKKGFTTTSMSEATQQTRQTIYKYQTGENKPAIDNAYAISKLLNCTVYEIWPDKTELKEIATVKLQVVKNV